MVMSTYGCDTRSPCTSISTALLERGAAISRPLRNWLETLPAIVVFPPATPFERSVTGGQSVPRSQATSTSSCCSALTRSPIGRSRMRSLPSSRYSPSPRAHNAVRNRMLVPLFSSHRSAVALGIRPPCPSTCNVHASRSCSTSKPSRRRLSTMTRVSSLSRTPFSVVVPDDSAATTSARLVRLFEPGGRIVPRTGSATGETR